MPEATPFPPFPPFPPLPPSDGPPTTGQRLLTPDLPPHSGAHGIPGIPPDGPRLSPAPAPARPNVMTLPPAAPLTYSSSTRAPRALNPAALFEPPAESINRIRARQRRRRAKGLLRLFVLVALVAGAAVAYVQLRPQSDGPSAWDPRVVPLVQFVEQNRGLQFDHPVAVEFVPAAEYEARLRSDAVDVSDDERAKAAYEEELNDAFGLTATYRLLENRGAIDALSSLGFYASETDSIVVRGDQLTPGVRATLVHELTHALQSQHFDLDTRLSDYTVRSIAEADAMEVEDAYMAALEPTDRWDASVESQMTPAAQAAIDAVPWTLVELEHAPYRLGRLAMDRRTTAGNAGIDAALTTPPTERQMIAPWAPDGGSTAGIVAAAPAGTTVVEENRPLSMLETLVMFDAWLPWSMARPALDTWVGGVFTTYRTTAGAPLCAAVRMRSTVPGETLATVVTWWSAAMGAPATPAVEGGEVAFTVCARGKGAPEPPKAAVPTTVAVELEITTVPKELIPTGPAPAVADPARPSLGQYLCVARTMVDDPALGPLITQAFPTAQQQATIDKGTATAVRHCIG
ncbi:MAG: hypothetical protein ACOYMR_09360 [Ilumatobacteraceae bacterium]